MLNHEEQRRLRGLHKELARVRVLLEYYEVERKGWPCTPAVVLLVSRLRKREYELVEGILAVQAAQGSLSAPE